MSEDTLMSDAELQAHRDRANVFRGLLFTETEAHLLAAAEASAEEAQRLLLHGCSHALVVRILI